MGISSFFQLWHLKTINFSPNYHSLWFSRPFWPFFLRNGEKRELRLFLPIFGKNALDMAKWLSETHGMGHKASFRLDFNPRTHFRFFENHAINFKNFVDQAS